MRQAVIDIFPRFSVKLEGCVPHMYLDIRGLVTIGVGCLIDPVSLAIPLNFKHRGSNTIATAADIRREFTKIKSNQYLAHRHYSQAGVMCKLYLPLEEVDHLLTQRLATFEMDLVKKFTQFGEWPAHAQLATMSMCWAMGSGFTRKFPSWSRHALAQNWEGCAKECLMRVGTNVGLIPRNHANRALFLSARSSDYARISIDVIRASHREFEGF